MIVKIKMSGDTPTTLRTEGYALYAWKAVRTSQRGGMPLVWHKEKNFSPEIPIQWDEQYQAYGSHEDIEPGEIIHPTSVGIELGEIWPINDSLMGSPKRGGIETAVTFLSEAKEAIRVGLSQPIEGDFSSYCVFPLHSGFSNTITPINKILMAFLTDSIEPGTVFGTSLSDPSGRPPRTEGFTPDLLAGSAAPGILIDLNKVKGLGDVQVSFDFSNGWDYENFNWARVVSPTENLLPLLIEPE